MKHNLLSVVIALFCLLLSSNVFAYDFKVDDKCYTIKSAADKTVEIVSEGTFSSYSGDFEIPSSVENNETNYTVVGIGAECFQFSSITSLVIPSTIRDIDSKAFMLCQTLSTIYNYASIPQNIDASTFYFSGHITLHVYEGLKQTYANAIGWSAMTIVDDISVTKVTSITLDKTSLICQPYESNKLTVTIAPDNASMKDVDWSSSDESVVYITPSGKFVGIKEGYAIVTATAKDGSGVTAECNVTVNKLSTQSESYNGFLKSITTGYSMISMGIINKYIGFNIQNNGQDFIKITKLRVINPNTDDVLVTSSDASLLGWLGNGETKNLQVTLHQDISPVYEWTYLYKDVEYVFRSDKTYTGLSQIDNDNVETAIQDVYTIDGKKTNRLNRGINVVKMSNGMTKKIICK